MVLVAHWWRVLPQRGKQALAAPIRRAYSHANRRSLSLRYRIESISSNSRLKPCWGVRTLVILHVRLIRPEGFRRQLAGSLTTVLHDGRTQHRARFAHVHVIHWSNLHTPARLDARHARLDCAHARLHSL